MEEIIIYTDGSCEPNPGQGGWGAYIQCNNVNYYIYGGEDNTTNNQMEMMAVIQALIYLECQCSVTVYTDSDYLKQGITSWVEKWKNNEWRTSKGKPVKNSDLWEILDDLNNFHEIDWNWVKGHNENPGNEMADQLANQGRIEQCEFKCITKQL